MFYDRFKFLAKSKQLSVHRATQEIGLSKSTATKWKNTGAMPSGETLSKIADYFGVTVDFLITGNDKKAPAEAEVKDDVGEMLEEILQMLGADDSISFNGKPMSDEAKELLLASLESNIKLADKISAMRQKDTGDGEE